MGSGLRRHRIGAAVLLSVALAGFVPTPVLSALENAGRYRCSVRDFFASDKSDPDFERKNRAKTFEIVESEDVLTVVSSSSEFDQATSHYYIVDRQLDRFAVEAGIVPSVISFSENASGDHGGDAEATVVVLGSSFANVWLLSCKAAN
jgi:hypothetical protein